VRGLFWQLTVIRGESACHDGEFSKRSEVNIEVAVYSDRFSEEGKGAEVDGR
jgi:hypothetical protein